MTPNLDVGQALQERMELLLCHPSKLKQAYTWEYITTSQIRDVLVNSDQGRQSAIALEQDSDGIDWSIAANNIESQRTAAG